MEGFGLRVSVVIADDVANREPAGADASGGRTARAATVVALGQPLSSRSNVHALFEWWPGPPRCPWTTGRRWDGCGRAARDPQTGSDPRGSTTSCVSRRRPAYRARRRRREVQAWEGCARCEAVAAHFLKFTDAKMLYGVGQGRHPFRHGPGGCRFLSLSPARRSEKNRFWASNCRDRIPKRVS